MSRFVLDFFFIPANMHELLEDFEKTVKSTRILFNISGVGFTRESLRPIRYAIFLIFFIASIMNNILLLSGSFGDIDMKEFASTTMFSCVQALTASKSICLLAYRMKFHECFKWIEKCFTQTFIMPQINLYWTELRTKTMNQTVLVSR